MSDKKVFVIDGIEITEENRFSTFIHCGKDGDDYKYLLSWQKWFATRDIKSVISSRHTRYALYRENLIKVELKTESRN